jgi:hypothetical protein
VQAGPDTHVCWLLLLLAACGPAYAPLLPLLLLLLLLFAACAPAAAAAAVGCFRACC